MATSCISALPDNRNGYGRMPPTAPTTWSEDLLVAELPDGPPAYVVCGALQGQPHPFLLDSAMVMDRYGRYSYAGCDPFAVITSKNSQITTVQQANRGLKHSDPFTALQQIMERYALPPTEAPAPFWGGAVGYFGYDLCHFIEDLPCTTVDDIGMPDLYMALYDVVYAYDEASQVGYLLSTGLPAPVGSERRKRAQARAEQLLDWIQSADKAVCSSDVPATSADLQSNFTRQEYLGAVSRTKEYIAAGDIFQVNLSQRFQAPLQISPWELYVRLRHTNPASFAAYLDYGSGQVVSASPEKFLEVRDGWVQTRPIKGTRPRGDTPEKDQRLAQELLDSEKDNAELMMIVDLERNDLGRVCRFGTVRVPELVVLESYPTVHHLMATVTGQLDEGCDNIDLMRAVFPGGSITGAPKVRSMEIIDELEPTQRGVSTGNIGYLGFAGQMQLSIVIRTIITTGGNAYYQVGGGIVADSQPAAEYQETLDKGEALAEALRDMPDSRWAYGT